MRHEIEQPHFKLSDIASVHINLNNRTIELYNRYGFILMPKWQDKKLSVGSVKFAKSSPVGLIIQGLVKWTYGKFVSDE